jgi:hypothetical protein
MKRQAHAALTRLEHMQKERRKLEKAPDASDRETQTEHRVIGLITQAFAEQPDPDDPDDEFGPINDANSVTPGQQPDPVYGEWAAQIRRVEQRFGAPSSDRTAAGVMNGRQPARPSPG